MAIPPKNSKPKIPSFDEVMAEDTPQIPSFNEVMGEKKSLGSSSKNGSLENTNGVSKPSEPDFGFPTRNQLATGQQSIADNTRSVSAMETIMSDDEKMHHEERAKVREENRIKVEKAKPIAIKNTAKKSLKIKGLNPNNAALLNSEIAKFTDEVESGSASVGFGKDGEVGLVSHPEAGESFLKHMMDDINQRKNAREFNTDDLDKKVEIAEKIRLNQSAYLAEKPTGFASLTSKAGDLLPTLMLYGAGAAAGGVIEMAAPETGGLSNLALKPVMSFVMNEGDGANQKGLQGTMERYNAILAQHPDMDKRIAMHHATVGEDVDRVAGILETAAFSATGGKLKLGKSVTGKLLKGMAHAAVDVGGKTALVTGVRDVGHNLEGVTHKSGSEILGDMAETFGENAPMGVGLHAFMGIAGGAVDKVSQLIKSALKFDVVTKLKPDEVKSLLDENVKRGAVTPEQAQKAETDLAEFDKTLQKVPEHLSDEAKASVTGLIIKRDNLKKQAEGKDESAKELHNQEIESINNQIKEIYRTGKPLEHEINPATGETFKQPIFDDVQKQRVKDLAKKIVADPSQIITDPELRQVAANFPQELEKELQRHVKEENSGNKDKEKPTTDIADNVEKFNKQNEKENTKLPNTEKETSVADESVDKIEQSTEKEQSTVTPERTPEEVKQIKREPIGVDNFEKSVKITDINSYKEGAKELSLKEVTAFEGRSELRKRLKAIDNITKCL